MCSGFYDLLATKLLLTEDPEEIALALDGKRARLSRADFVSLARRLHVADKAIDATFERFADALPDLRQAIDASFLRVDTKQQYRQLLADRAERLTLP